jgi:predicted transcriptional regulator
VSKENAEIMRRLRETGAAFIEAHDRAALAIREASHAGMTVEGIAHTSGLSHATVDLFLRAGEE